MSKKAIIPGGFYLKARKIQQSRIQHAPPHVRETWEWLLMKANHTDAKWSGRIIRRGQLFCSWRDIQEGLHWMIGYRKMRYSQAQCENATKWLLAAEMITATKTIRGRIITIVNYDLYQNSANYEYRNECRNERHSVAEVLPNDKQEGKNEKNGKKKKKCKNSPTPKSFTPPTVEQVREYAITIGFSEIDAERFVSWYAAADWHKKDGSLMRNWKQSVVNWKGGEKEREDGQQLRIPEPTTPTPEQLAVIAEVDG